MQTEKDFQDTFTKSISTLQHQDRTAFITSGFNTFLTYQLPLIVEQCGSFTAYYKGLKYDFSVSKPRSYNSPASLSDDLDFALAQMVPVTARLKLEVTNPKTKDTILCSKVRTTIFHLPVPTGRQLKLYEPVLEDKQDLENQFLPSGAFSINGKLRSIPCIKEMANSKMILVDKQTFVRLQVRSSHWKKPFRITSTMNFDIATKNKKPEQEGFISCEIPWFQNTFHVGILAQALGCNPHTFCELIKAAAV